MFFGRFMCTTKRTLLLSMPIPKAMVATMICTSSLRKASWFCSRTSRFNPAWYGPGLKAVVVELGAELLGLLATQGIDDPTIALVVLQKIHELIEAAAFGLHVVLNIGPVEARHKNLGPLQFELVENVVTGQLVCRSREGDHGHVGQGGAEFGQLQVFRTEIVTPLRDAMRLVNGDQIDLRALQGIHEIGVGQQALGGDVQGASPLRSEFYGRSLGSERRSR